MFQNLSEREKLFVLGGAIFAVVMLVSYAVIEARSAKDDRIARLEELRAHIKKARTDAARYQSVTEADVQRKELESDKVLPTVENALKQYGIIDKAKGLSDKPPTEQKQFLKTTVSVRLNDVDFQPLKNFLYQLEVQSPYFLQVEEFSLIKRPNKAGVYDARMTIASYAQKKK